MSAAPAPGAGLGQRFYFGDAIDYQVSLGERATLRAIAFPAQTFAVGDTVNVLIHPGNCVAVRNE